ncbi:NfeD family protein [Halobacterium jilantaiense]|uniref:Membrane protein implicated in regulation of membrane protease activity n=1 Tax=Halobacterium jilantaiense TaxID=355548 RepID=A0A1I0NWZ6_9EURY|nr:NfeD family protein [Halobacterium jilantaiense]SEW06354.1 Membrane protein implicated in regulation of membrane protease activity [Halobacterium jilantaiense]
MDGVFGQSLSFVLVVAGAVLCIAEALVPGAHLIVLGVALLSAGLVGMFLLSNATPFVLAGVVFIVGMVALYVYRYYEIYEGTDSGQTLASSDLRGKTGYVVEEVTSRSGRIDLEGGGFNSSYAARSTVGTIPVDEEVVVVDPGGGNVVTVEPVDDSADDTTVVSDAGGPGDAGQDGDAANAN